MEDIVLSSLEVRSFFKLKENVMKRISFYLFAMLIGTMSFLMSCSDDDDDDTTVASEKVAGTYNGNLVVKLMGQEVANETKSLSLVKNGDDAVNVVIKDFILSVSIGEASIPVSLGDLKVEKCALTQKDGKYTFSGATELKGIKVPITETSELPVDCTVDIADATVDGKNLSLPIVVGVSMSGGEKFMDVNVQYTGVKQ